jgi:hypothetical protein
LSLSFGRSLQAGLSALAFFRRTPAQKELTQGEAELNEVKQKCSNP